ncbi:MAG: hypothetical protein IJN83_05670 [Clostridia bacterium]|nr:hypothetical protein [Clostridia bacterium]
MKKIFAIALALVMVLSMASAFALSACDTRTYAWGCLKDNDYCGTAKVEIVPYVHVNAECNGDEFVVSNCAGAVAGENLYVAIKLTVDAYPYAPWFENAQVLLESAGIKDVDWSFDEEDNKLKVLPLGDDIDMEADEEEVYYWVGGEWVNVDDVADDFVVGDPLHKFVADNAKKVELCAKIESEYNGYSEVNEIGDYTVEFKSMNNVTMDFDKKGNYTGYIEVKGDDGESATYYVNEGNIKSVSEGAEDDFVAEVADYLNLGCGIGVCVNKDNIKANFGWDDEQESCFAWSKSAMAIVDAECVVAIPKTGDASVLAWLF